MQATYHIKDREVEIFIRTIRKLVEDGEELIITVNSNKAQSLPAKDEQEKLFKTLFGSWAGDETGDELVEQIYSARVSGTRDVEL